MSLAQIDALVADAHRLLGETDVRFNRAPGAVLAAAPLRLIPEPEKLPPLALELGMELTAAPAPELSKFQASVTVPPATGRLAGMAEKLTMVGLLPFAAAAAQHRQRPNGQRHSTHRHGASSRPGFTGTRPEASDVPRGAHGESHPTSKFA
jgi:hypothetical protein